MIHVIQRDSSSSSLDRIEPENKPLKVLFLSSDTGGGHRASAEALGAQFQTLYPGSTYTLVDLVKEHSHAPYNTLVESYKHLSAHPHQWNLVYKLSNSPPVETFVKTHLKITTEKSVRQTIRKHNPDVVISVHPLMTNVPVASCQKISSETGKHLPMFTVVTDLGSGHCTWFDAGVEKMFIASERIQQLAMKRGKVPKNKLIMSGLPIRKDFSWEADSLGPGGRNSLQGKVHQAHVREMLGLDCDHGGDCNRNSKVVLVMGGGEGVGSLSSVVDALYMELASMLDMCVTIVVVCGRNDKLRQSLDGRDWNQWWMDHSTRQGDKKSHGAILQPHQVPLHHLDSTRQRQECTHSTEPPSRPGNRMDWKGIASFPLLRVFRKQPQDENGNHSMTTTTTTREPPPDETETVESPLDDTGMCTPEEVSDSSTEETLPSETVSDMMVSTAAEVTAVQTERVHSSSASPSASACPSLQSNIKVLPLGFVDNMAQWMVAADVLVTKAGPGTIAEAASVGLPVLLTSFLPGQEEGNVDFVLEHNFGEYQSDKDPPSIAKKVASWLQNVERLHEMSQGAMKAGNPHAAEQIVRRIGTSVLRWKELHPEQQQQQQQPQQEQQQEGEKEQQHQPNFCLLENNNRNQKSDLLRTLNSQISQASC